MRKLLALIALLVPLGAHAQTQTIISLDNAAVADLHDDVQLWAADSTGSAWDRGVLLSRLLSAITESSGSFTIRVLDSASVDTQAELEALLTDATNILDSAEVDTEAEIEAILQGSANIIVATEIDSYSELSGLISDLESGIEGVVDLQDLQGAVTDGQVPNNITITLAATATALAANGANCTAGSAPLGVDASGAAESCTDYEEDLSNSAGLAGAISDETGTNLLVFSNSPVLVTPDADQYGGAANTGNLLNMAQSGGTGVLLSGLGDVKAMIDSDNNGSASHFAVQANGVDSDLFYIEEDGDGVISGTFATSSGFTGLNQSPLKLNELGVNGTNYVQHKAAATLGGNIEVIWGDDIRTCAADEVLEIASTGAGTITVECDTDGGGSTAFSDLTAGTNSSAAMVVGTGASLSTSGTGTIVATGGGADFLKNGDYGDISAASTVLSIDSDVVTVLEGLAVTDSLGIPTLTTLVSADCDETPEIGRLVQDTDEDSGGQIYNCEDDGAGGAQWVKVGSATYALDDLTDVSGYVGNSNYVQMATNADPTTGAYACYDADNNIEECASSPSGDEMFVGGTNISDGTGLDLVDGTTGPLYYTATLTTGTSPDEAEFIADSLKGAFPIDLEGTGIGLNSVAVSPNADDDYLLDLSASNFHTFTLDGTGELDSVFVTGVHPGLKDRMLTMLISQPADPGDTVSVYFDTSVFTGGPVTVAQNTTLPTIVTCYYLVDEGTCKLNADEQSVDISDDTNLTAGDHLTLTDDDIDLDAEVITHVLSFYVEDPVTDEEFLTLWVAPAAITITAIHCEATGGTSVVADFEIDDGTPAAVNGGDITCTTTFATDASLAGDTGMADGDRLDLDFGTVTGSVTSLSIAIEYTIDD